MTILLFAAAGLGWLVAHPEGRVRGVGWIMRPLEHVATREDRLRLEMNVIEEMRLSRSGNPGAMVRVAEWMIHSQTLSFETRKRVGLASTRPTDGWALMKRAARRGESRARYRIWQREGGRTSELRDIVDTWHGPGIYAPSAELARRALASCDQLSIESAIRGIAVANFRRAEWNGPGFTEEHEATRRGFDRVCSNKRSTGD